MALSATSTSSFLELVDWRRRIAELFLELRRRPPDADALRWFRESKDELFRSHPQSPLPPEERSSFAGLAYWPYDPNARVEAYLEPDAEAPPPRQATDAEVAFFRIGWLHFDLHGASFQLGAYWIQGYAGGLFVPFRDQTAGHETYGGGRYLLDTIKSADFGSDLASLAVMLDFNYAYHPSCTYDPRWICPLAPPENRLAVPVRAGERLAGEGHT
jgi:uncharacterized protein